jgi:hypothetical protein
MQEVCDRATITGQLTTEFGWTLTLDSKSVINPRSLMNFPMQANGAEMMRLACCLATEDGLEIVAPVHDALGMVAPIEQLNFPENSTMSNPGVPHATMRSRVLTKGFCAVCLG